MMKDSNLSPTTKLTSLACSKLRGGRLCSRELSGRHHGPRRCRVCPCKATTSAFGAAFGAFLGAESVLCVRRG